MHSSAGSLVVPTPSAYLGPEPARVPALRRLRTGHPVPERTARSPFLHMQVQGQRHRSLNNAHSSDAARRWKLRIEHLHGDRAVDERLACHPVILRLLRTALGLHVCAW